MNENITWAPMIPLIGGFPIAAEKITNVPPKYVASFDVFWGNDKLYMNYLRQRNIDVSYITDSKALSSVDIVVSTCPCAGLSMLNASKNPAKSGALAEQNQHMYNSTNAVLEYVKPKVLVGENAPTLFTDRGKLVANELLNIAKTHGYSYTLYKTSTEYHGIPQRRDRTFYFMWKSKTAPILDWYAKDSKILSDFLDEVDSNMPHYDDLINPSLCESGLYKFIATNNADIRNTISSSGLSAFGWLMKSGKLQEFRDWCEAENREADLRFANRAIEKTAAGLNIWDNTVYVPRNQFNALTGKTMYAALHPTQPRSLNMREALHLMGMPSDFVIESGIKDAYKITQNVPVCTAADMVEQCVKFIRGELQDSGYNYTKQNNHKKVFYGEDTANFISLEDIL